jgi:hypothetical protein
MATVPSAAELVSELVHRVWNNGDLAAVSMYVADGYMIHHDPGDAWEGQRLSVADYASRVDAYRHQYPDLRYTLLDIFAGVEDQVLVIWLSQATIVAAPDGSSAGQARELKAAGATIYYINSGKLTGHRQVMS